MKKKYLLYSILLANMAALPAGAALSASVDNVPTHDNVPGVDQKSIRDSLAYEAYLDSISRQFDLTEVVVTGTRTPKFLKDTPIQTRVIGSKDIAKLDATNVQDLLQQELPGVEFSYAMNQQTHLNFSGFGGQGVLSMGVILARPGLCDSTSVVGALFWKRRFGVFSPCGKRT